MAYRIEKAAVIGAGTMGLGIAGQLANADVDVLLLDRPSNGASRNALAERALERLQNPDQPGLLHPGKLDRIRIGNVEDDLHRIGDADWIAEAVVERLDVKRALYRQVNGLRKPGSIVSSNTSTIPISLLVEGMPESFRREFAITHFFNPARFMRLLELVRGEDTLPEVMDSLERFCDRRLGKGVVVCGDTPGFLANRVGVFAIQCALHAAFRLGLSPEDADAVFGRPMGVPKTGVFGLYDLIGIDLMGDVVKSLVSILPPGDAFHEVAGEIPVMSRMIGEGLTGDKSGRGGFYRREKGGDRRTLDFDSFAYRDFDRARPGIAEEAEHAGDFTLLLQDEGPLGEFAWEVLSGALCYAASLVPGVSESLVAIDDAMKLGYNWIQGPFELMDSMGVETLIERLQSEQREVPAFLEAARGRSFYRVNEGRLQYLSFDGGYRNLERAPGIRRFSEERRTLSPLLGNRRASYYAVDGPGGPVGLLEFHSKANTLDGESMKLLAAATAHASANFQGLIVHNDAPHFSCGVNLAGVLEFIEAEHWAGLERFLFDFQETVLAMRDAPVPVVAAAAGLSLGGGFEVLLHCDSVVFHANSVTGLVESLVGLVPGGGGVKETLYRWVERKGVGESAAWETFRQIGYARTAASPLEGRELTMFRDGKDRFVMNRDRLLDTAVRVVAELSDGYRPAARMPIPMAGREVCGKMTAWLDEMRKAGKLTPHDCTTGAQLAMIVTGGDVDQGAMMQEADILGLERKAFVNLARTPETQARIRHILEFGTHLRN